ncbi:MAG: hypothetical protein HFG26_08865 [Provencibacterium sp.]|jgi:chromosome segregation ATPase|nr:hypothetical protein [Provencibacterium sp.]
MALTRKFLKAMGIEEEKIDQIIEAHTETVSGLKDSLDKAEAAAKDLPGVQKELDAARADLEAVKKDGWKDKHDTLKKEFEDYKKGVTAKEAKAAKEAAARAYYESKGITGKALEIAMRGSGAEIEALELAEGKIKDAAALEALVKGDFSGLVSTTTTTGANTANPPANSGGGMNTPANTRAAQIAALYHNNLYGELKKE